MSKRTDSHLAIATLALSLPVIACGFFEPLPTVSESTADIEASFEELPSTSGVSTEVDTPTRSFRKLDDEQGFVSYRTFDPEIQELRPELVIMEPSGRELHRISIPGASGPARRLRRTCLGSRVLGQVQIEDELRTVLVDAADGLAWVLEIPPDTFLDESHQGFWGNECVEVLYDRTNVRPYVVDTNYGEVIEITSIELDRFDRHLPYFNTISNDYQSMVLATDSGSWLVPIANPEDARSLADGNSFFVSFSSDSQWLVYARGERIDGLNEIVVERVDGSVTSTVMEGQGPLLPSFIPGQARLVIYSEDRLTTFDINSGLQTDVLTFPEGELGLIKFSPSGKNMIVLNTNDSQIAWQLIDLTNGTVSSLHHLAGYMPVENLGGFSVVSDKRWLSVAYPSHSGSMTPSEAFGMLDLESGDLHQILHLDQPSRIGVLDSTPDGRAILFQTIPDTGDAPAELYFLGSDNEVARLVDTAADGGFSGSIAPGGNWIAFSRTEVFEGRIERTLFFAGAETTEILRIAEGSDPIWVYP